MLITRETDYALRMLRVLLDGEKHSAAEMAETELIPLAFFRWFSLTNLNLLTASQSYIKIASKISAIK